MAKFDIENLPVISPATEKAVARAFVEYEEERHLSVPRREHLSTEWRAGVCCRHLWMPVPPTEPNTKLLRETFEEKDLGEQQLYCTACGALSLWEQDLSLGQEAPMLWAYDATAKFGRPAIALKPIRGPRPTRPPSRR